MEWFAMSAKYYIDLEDSGVSERAEVFLTRACAYMADNETGGFLPRTALKRINLSAISRRIDELSEVGVMVERDDKTGWDFPAWFKWNEPLERQVKKRKADRDRVRKKRSESENVARQSRSVSRDVASPHNSTEHISTTYVEESPYVSDARKPSRGRARVDAINATAHSAEAHTIVREYERRIGKIPGDSMSKIAQAVDGCLQSGYDSGQIHAGLDAWGASDMVSPSQIANFVLKSANRSSPAFGRPSTAVSTADQRVAQAQALKNTPGAVWPGGPLELT
ncbi:hypothetical protein F8M49_06340 [Rhodococcus zopfii]|uniref:Uncharacterized protein n=2 Tax=Rhodococcus zopfii TaxID=43772 RepID=A0ABU3WMB7_9NOCA|nr:hypothetical protein [Rhodococcus zopfii]